MTYDSDRKNRVLKGLEFSFKRKDGRYLVRDDVAVLVSYINEIQEGFNNASAELIRLQTLTEQFNKVIK